MATHSRTLLRGASPGQRGLGATAHRAAKSWTLSNSMGKQASKATLLTRTRGRLGLQPSSRTTAPLPEAQERHPQTPALTPLRAARHQGDTSGVCSNGVDSLLLGCEGKNARRPGDHISTVGSSPGHGRVRRTL